MQVLKLQNYNDTPSFYAGQVKLNEIKKTLLPNYDKIVKIAENGKFDLSITKSYMTNRNIYISYAIRNEKCYPYCNIGIGCTSHYKNAKNLDEATSLYQAVIQSIKNLAENIEQKTGTKPNFIKYLANQ